MSRLTSRAPEAVVIDGVSYPLNTNFRNCLLTVALLNDSEIFDYEKADILLENMFFEPYPENVNEAMAQAVNYLMQNRDTKKEEQNHPILLDFEQDGQMIYDAFLSKGVNLDIVDIPFWEFLAHLRELPKGCLLNRVIYLRSQQSRNKLTKEEREEIRRLGHDVVDVKVKPQRQDYSGLESEIDDYFNSL